MSIRVVSYNMAFIGHSADKVWIPLRFLSNDEERSRHAFSAQHIQ
jgi:hypothetical protein